jgi:hypothetical protein
MIRPEWPPQRALQAEAAQHGELEQHCGADEAGTGARFSVPGTAASSARTAEPANSSSPAASTM